jgi:hypothetical protein
MRNGIRIGRIAGISIYLESTVIATEGTENAEK